MAAHSQCSVALCACVSLISSPEAEPQFHFRHLNSQQPPRSSSIKQTCFFSESKIVSIHCEHHPASFVTPSQWLSLVRFVSCESVAAGEQLQLFDRVSSKGRNRHQFAMEQVTDGLNGETIDSIWTRSEREKFASRQLIQSGRGSF